MKIRPQNKILIRKNHETSTRNIGGLSSVGVFLLTKIIQHTGCSTAYRKQKCSIKPCVSFSKLYIKRISASNVPSPTTSDLMLERDQALYNELTIEG